jgi:hypothetical protein
MIVGEDARGHERKPQVRELASAVVLEKAGRVVMAGLASVTMTPLMTGGKGKIATMTTKVASARY